MKDTLLFTSKICTDILSTYDIQENKNISEIEYLFLSICLYTKNRKIDYLKYLGAEQKRFFVAKVKNIIDNENDLHIEKSKKRMIQADNKKKEEDKKNNKENNYKLNFDKIKPITKVILYRNDLIYIWNKISETVKNKSIKISDIDTNFLLFLIISILDYFLNNKKQTTQEFINSYCNFVFEDIKKDIDRHFELYNIKIENKKETKKEDKQKEINGSEMALEKRKKMIEENKEDDEIELLADLYKNGLHKNRGKQC